MAADPNDLATLANLKAFIGNISATSDDGLLQMLLTGASIDFLQDCGIQMGAGGNALNSSQFFSEVYNGNGSQRLYLRNRPITAVASLLVSGVAVPQSLNAGQAGYYIDQAGESIIVRSSTMQFAPPSTTPLYFTWLFDQGIGNVFVTYTAGYSVTPMNVQDVVCADAAIEYKRRGWLDEKSRSMPGGGTTTFRDEAYTRKRERLVLRYKRFGLVL